MNIFDEWPVVKCSGWSEFPIVTGWNKNDPIYKIKQICNGTKEREECSCYGDPNKCNFYPEKRKANKNMNTAEMWIKAQEDEMCYETVEQGPDGVTLYYKKDKGLFDDNSVRCGPEMWNYFDDLMNEQWRLRAMTKSEAEAKFNIKIIGD